MALTMKQLMSKHAHNGRVEWIGARVSRRGDVTPLDSVFIADTGLEGDRRAKPGKRAVTLIQFEHLGVIASLLGVEEVALEDLRRNIAVSGINLLALRNAEFQIGSCVLKGAGLCAPCSRMEETFGVGGYNAVRGHGGITAEVVTPGDVAIGSSVAIVSS